MTDSVRRFYDEFSGDYHLLFADWPASVHRQAEVLERLIRGELGDGPLSVLDCACGIGTQAIGLATRGFRVHATDLSPAAVERAEREAARRSVLLTTGVADLRALSQQVPGQFDVVLACDNALPHLPSDEDLLRAASHMRAKLRPGGLFLASIRDYDGILADKPLVDEPRVLDGPDGRRIAFQVWDWQADGRTYTVHQFVVIEAESGWQTRHRATEYRAVLREELGGILRAAGLAEIRWRMPAESGYYQPIVVARRPVDVPRGQSRDTRREG